MKWQENSETETSSTSGLWHREVHDLWLPQVWEISMSGKKGKWSPLSNRISFWYVLWCCFSMNIQLYRTFPGVCERAWVDLTWEEKNSLIGWCNVKLRGKWVSRQCLGSPEVLGPQTQSCYIHFPSVWWFSCLHVCAHVFTFSQSSHSLPDVSAVCLWKSMRRQDNWEVRSGSKTQTAAWFQHVPNRGFLK